MEKIIIIIIHVLIGPLILILGLVFRAYPPKKINDLYGYRSKRSKYSQETWDYANNISSNYIIKIGITTTLLQISIYSLYGHESSIIIATIFMVFSLVVSIFFTEQKLKEKFGDCKLEKNNKYNYY